MTAASETITGVGRLEIERRLRESQSEVQKLRAELAAATKKIDEIGAAESFLRRRVTELQVRGTELVEKARAARQAEAGMRLMLDIHPLAPLLVRLDEARKKHPGGSAIVDLVAEVGEVAKAQLRETPERVRDELLDVAVVALRLFLGERKNDGIHLAGWTCSSCREFNGEEQERRVECRSCGADKRG